MSKVTNKHMLCLRNKSWKLGSNLHTHKPRQISLCAAHIAIENRPQLWWSEGLLRASHENEHYTLFQIYHGSHCSMAFSEQVHAIDISWWI